VDAASAAPDFSGSSVDIDRGLACPVDGEQVYLWPLALAIKRATKLYRKRGPAGFFVSWTASLAEARSSTPKDPSKPARSTSEGHGLQVVNAQNGVLSHTLRKAIKAARLRAKKSRSASARAPSTRRPAIRHRFSCSGLPRCWDPVRWCARVGRCRVYCQAAGRAAT
jgi:hypothetical protein